MSSLSTVYATLRIAFMALLALQQPQQNAIAEIANITSTIALPITRPSHAVAMESITEVSPLATSKAVPPKNATEAPPLAPSKVDEPEGTTKASPVATSNAVPIKNATVALHLTTSKEVAPESTTKAPPLATSKAVALKVATEVSPLATSNEVSPESTTEAPPLGTSKAIAPEDATKASPLATSKAVATKVANEVSPLATSNAVPPKGTTEAPPQATSKEVTSENTTKASTLTTSKPIAPEGTTKASPVTTSNAVPTKDATEVPPLATTNAVASEVTTKSSPMAMSKAIPPEDTTDAPPVVTQPQPLNPSAPYCAPALCALYNGSHVLQLPHIACENNGTFAPTCGAKPHLLYMSERRRNLILDMHNLARARVAAGQLNGYKPAAHMPLLKWDAELEYLATLHVKRCQFAHDQCRNTARYQYSGQNIGYYWIGRAFKSHSKRMKSFVFNWFREYRDANQSFIDHYQPHPEGKKIGHFTMLASDRAHRVGCAAIRFRDPDQMVYMKLLMTCNYDFSNIIGEPIYQSGPTASKCAYKISEKYPALCDWKDAVYDYDSEESAEDNNQLDNIIQI